jgi:hypothetical protein
MPTTGYHLLAPEAVPLRFWQTQGEDQETIACLRALQCSLQDYGVCWVIWDTQQQAFYEQRDLYRCSIVTVDEYDILDRAIPYGDLRNRASLPIFFSAQEFQQIMALDSHKQEPACKKACAFVTDIPGDGLGKSPIGTINVTIPSTTFCRVVESAREDAAQRGKPIVTLHAYLLYLQAALLVLDEQIQHEPDRARRRTMIQQREQLQRMRAIRSQWRHQHKQYVEVSQHSHDMYIVHVGLHPSVCQQVA